MLQVGEDKTAEILKISKVRKKVENSQEDRKQDSVPRTLFWPTENAKSGIQVQEKTPRDEPKSTHVQKKQAQDETLEKLVLSNGKDTTTGGAEITPRLPLEIAGRVLLAVVDSGASVNLIRSDLVQGETRPVTHHIRWVTQGHTIKPRGAIDIVPNLGGVPVSLTFLVVDDLAEEAILGREFLEAEDVVIDWKRRAISYGTDRRHILYWTDQRAAPRTALTSELLRVRIQDLVPEDRKEEYLQEILKYADAFSEEPIPATAVATQHRIILRDTVPVRVAPYRCSEPKKRMIDDACREMLVQGVIRRSHSDYNSPVLLVKKKDGDQRFCVDYRRLNEKTEAEVGTLPQIFDTIRELGDAQYFSTLDLKAGYWQVPMEEESKKYTAFSTPDGDQFEFEVMPFGLTGAPGTFQKLMNQVLEGYIHKFVKVYLDDVVVYSRTHEEHLYHLAAVLERLRQHGLHVSPGKCRFGSRQIDYLGHTITDERNEPQKHYLKRIEDYPVPRSIKELRSFLGTAGWLREYVPGFAEIASPLTDVLEGTRGFKWGMRQQEAFEKLKEALVNHADLHRPLSGVQFCLQTDASSIGMGAVLFQFDPEDPDKRRLIACASAKFTKTERRYHVNEQETLAVTWGVRKFRQFLEDRPFRLYTDSRALLWLDRYKDEKSKLMRWALMLQAYEFEVIHVPGRCNELPDFLSRNPEQEDRPEQPEEVDDRAYPIGMIDAEPAGHEDNPEEDREEEGHEVPEEVPVPQVDPLFERVVQDQKNDPYCRTDRERLERILRVGADTAEERNVARSWFVEDGLIWQRREDDARALLVGTEMRPVVLEEYHESPLAAHPGIDETQRAIQRVYGWPDLSTDVRSFVKSCMICAATKASRQTAAPLRPRVPVMPWRTVSLDVLGPYPKTRRGNVNILMVTDLFSKWVEAKAVPSGKLPEILVFLDEVTARWGFPEAIITDNASTFTGRRWVRYMERHHITHYTVPVYHQQANPVERRVQELKKILRTKAESSHRWDETLQETLFALRTRTNAATGQTPAEVVLGANLPRPGDWAIPRQVCPPPDRTAPARQRRIDQAREKTESYVQKNFPTEREARTEFSAGEEVMVRDNQAARRDPFRAKWTGPHRVIARHGDNTYTVEREGRHWKLHVDDLRPRPPARPE